MSRQRMDIHALAAHWCAVRTFVSGRALIARCWRRHRKRIALVAIVVHMNSTTLSRSPASGRDPQAPDAPQTSPVPGAPSVQNRSAGWGQRVWRGRSEDPSWARPALIGLLVATAVFYLYNLTASGWANSFYSAAVQAGSTNLEAFFFGSSDAGNSITVDKPPASLWVMALSVKLLGLNSFAILFPQVVMGVASVGVLYATVRKSFGAPAGLIAGAVLALTPVAVLMFRFNNPDALLTLLMVLAAWATLKSIEKTSPRWFMAVGVFIGLAFLTKTLQAFLVVPGFALAYLVAAKTTLPKRIWHTILGGLAIVVSAGWWVAVVELLPANLRPYVGGSQTNSFLELTLGYNGLGRITGDETGSVGGGGTGTGRNWGATGLGRMFNSEIGGQISWLIPAALILLAVGLVLRGRAPRTDALRAAYLAWGAWLVVTLLTFSLMAGIFHSYYTIALAPAIAALVGMGAAEAWEHRDRAVGSIALAVATAATAVWGFVLLSRTTEWSSWLRVVVLAVGLTAAFGFLAASRMHRRALPVVVGAALFAGLLGPAAYSVQTVATGHSGSIVDAGPTVAGAQGGPGGGGTRGGMPGQAPGGTTGQAPDGTTGGTRGGAAGGIGGLLSSAAPSTAVVSALSTNAGQYQWVAAAAGSQNAAGLQLGTQLPVMAIGGFNGSDPSPTLAQFQTLVQEGKIHYFLAGGGVGGNQNGGSNAASQISTWVQQSFKAVTIGTATFYDLTQTATAGISTTATPAVAKV
jgi:4-amino-4-deoxy-L-arabinose transferase-like glycosyltransferase